MSSNQTSSHDSTEVEQQQKGTKATSTTGSLTTDNPTIQKLTATKHQPITKPQKKKISTLLTEHKVERKALIGALKRIPGYRSVTDKTLNKNLNKIRNIGLLPRWVEQLAIVNKPFVDALQIPMSKAVERLLNEYDVDRKKLAEVIKQKIPELSEDALEVRDNAANAPAYKDTTEANLITVLLKMHRQGIHATWQSPLSRVNSPFVEAYEFPHNPKAPRRRKKRNAKQKQARKALYDGLNDFSASPTIYLQNQPGSTPYPSQQNSQDPVPTDEPAANDGEAPSKENGNSPATHSRLRQDSNASSVADIISKLRKMPVKNRPKSPRAGIADTATSADLNWNTLSAKKKWLLSFTLYFALLISILLLIVGVGLISGIPALQAPLAMFGPSVMKAIVLLSNTTLTAGFSLANLIGVVLTTAGSFTMLSLLYNKLSRGVLLSSFKAARDSVWMPKWDTLSTPRKALTYVGLLFMLGFSLMTLLTGASVLASLPFLPTIVTAFGGVSAGATTTTLLSSAALAQGIVEVVAGTLLLLLTLMNPTYRMAVKALTNTVKGLFKQNKAQEEGTRLSEAEVLEHKNNLNLEMTNLTVNPDKQVEQVTNGPKDSGVTPQSEPLPVETTTAPTPVTSTVALQAQ